MSENFVDLWDNMNKYQRYSVCIRSLKLYDDKNKYFWSKFEWKFLPLRIKNALLESR